MSELLTQAEELFGDMVELRRRIHREPEVGLQLPRTQEKILDALDGLPLEITTGRSTTSVVATLHGEASARSAGSDPGRSVLLRGDMDALPMPEDTGLEFSSTVDGAMHACGHDSHVAMLVGAARMLCSRRGALAGRVRFMFQPGEEGHHGARFMIDEGLLDGPPIDGAFAIHVTPSMPSGSVFTRPGPQLASTNTVNITVRGRGGHASWPANALDPIPVACELVLALQSLVTRRIDIFDPAVLTIAKITSGTTDNVIPEAAHLLGTLRTLSESTREKMLDGIRRVADGVCAAHGATAEVDLPQGYPVTVNDDEFATWVLDLAGELLGPDRSHLMRNPVMGAEDFSYVLQRVPGAMVFLGAAPPGVSDPAPIHSNRMVMDERAMITGAALHTRVALSFTGSRP